MKQLTLLLLLSTIVATAQTTAIISIDGGRIWNSQTERNSTFALNIGIMNWKYDKASIGVVVKTNDGMSAYGFRFGGSISMIKDWAGVYLENDYMLKKGSYYYYKDINGKDKKEDFSQLIEVGAGFWIRYEDFFILAGVKSDDYDYSKKFITQPAITAKLTYVFKFKQL